MGKGVVFMNASLVSKIMGGDDPLEREPNSRLGIYLTDGTACTLGVSHSYEMLTEIEEREVIGRNMRVLEEEGFFDRSVTLLVLKYKAPITIEQSILKTGKKVIVTGNPIFNQDGNIVLVATTVYPHFYPKDSLVEIPNTLHPFSAIGALDGVVINSKAMHDALIRAVKAAIADSTVLISGESGVGKEVIARIIHQLSPRKNQPFIKVNVTAIPEELFESELFGYCSGAFTGALKSGKPGLVQAAAGGTLFLDEISEVPLKTQVKLLRLLQEKEVFPVGSIRPERVDVRFIAATNRDLRSLVKGGHFREDLYYRLNVVPIYIPPLRERKEDIYALANHFLKEFCNRYRVEKHFTPSAVQALLEYPWPGNVRELQNLVERLVILYSQNKISREQIYDELEVKPFPPARFSWTPGGFSLPRTVANFEREIIEQALKQNDGNIEQTAKMLGIHRTTLIRKLRKHGIGKQ